MPVDLRKISIFMPCLLCNGLPTPAGVLPDDRADTLYHSYDGGEVEITGPSLLVLKSVRKDFP